MSRLSRAVLAAADTPAEDPPREGQLPDPPASVSSKGPGGARRSRGAGWKPCGLLLPALFFAVAMAAAPAVQKEPISLDLASADLKDVLRSFETMTEASVDLDPRVQGKVTLRLREVSWATALDAICEGAGCRWRLFEGPPRRLEIRPRRESRPGEGLETPVDLVAETVPASEALHAVAKASGRSLELEGDFTMEVRAVLDGVTAATALTALCEGLGCDWSLSQDDGSLRVRRSPRRAAAGEATGAISGDLRERLRTSLDLRLAEAPLGAVLQSFAKVLEADLELHDEVGGSVTVELGGVSFETALNTVCSAHGCRWSLDGDPSPPRLRIFPDRP